ncbi:hypothetical protein BDC45DRAFT_536574 [Circinella umbellata]|nr:hypothetical protein BDC45DRAFT_536574 [Circinella umbellata]
MNPSITDLAGQIGQWTQQLQEREQQLNAEYNRLQTFRNDYDALEKILMTLPDQTTRSAMIPIGKLALMPGKLIHTNEITVYLGDQYYAERSAKQALGILDRRRQVVDENLRLLEARRNGLQAKNEAAGQAGFPSADLGVNEEGLPIVEIREEEPPKETAKIAVVESSKGKEVKKKSIKPKAEAWTEKDQKDVMAMLERLEAEEEEEEELPHDDQKQLMEKKKVSFADHDEYYDENKKNDDDEEEDEDDDDDWDERYDTEIADNLFSSYDDDEDYATQGIVDQVDASVYEEDGEEEEEEEEEEKEIQEIEPPINAENVSDRSTEASSSNIEQSPLKESVTEKGNIPVNSSKTSSLDKNISTATANTKTVLDETASSTTVPPSKTKKPSRFKVARQKERSVETVARNIAAAAGQQNMEKETVKREEEIPVVKESLSLNEKSKQPIRPTSTKQQTSSTIPVVQEKKTTTSSVPAPSANKETKNTNDIEKGKEKKNISKFKLAREQERNVAVFSPSSSSAAKENQFSSDSTVINEQTPSEKVTPPVVKKEKKVSKFKLTRQKARAREGGSDFVGVVVPEIPAVKDTSKKQPKTNETNDDEDKDSKSKRKVTWDTVATVQEHDRSAAPSTVSSDSSSLSYTAPVKEEKGKGIDTKVPLKPRTINSPADIFSALNDQRQILLDDGYPSLETGEDDTLVANQESGLDIDALTKDVDLKIQDIWRFRDEAANPLISTINPSEVNNIPQVRKSKLDSNVMRGAVTERDSEEVDLDQVEQDMDLREVTSKYHSQRNSIVAAMGGYSFDSKDVYEVYDENIPSNESSVTKDTDEVEEKPRKVSRFKAARMAALENSLEEQ